MGGEVWTGNVFSVVQYFFASFRIGRSEVGGWCTALRYKGGDGREEQGPRTAPQGGVFVSGLTRSGRFRLTFVFNSGQWMDHASLSILQALRCLLDVECTSCDA